VNAIRGTGGANMGNGSMDLNYCQGTVLYFYHSNVGRGSGVVGMIWREFGSLVRRWTERKVRTRNLDTERAVAPPI